MSTLPRSRPTKIAIFVVGGLRAEWEVTVLELIEELKVDQYNVIAVPWEQRSNADLAIVLYPAAAHEEEGVRQEVATVASEIPCRIAVAACDLSNNVVDHAEVRRLAVPSANPFAGRVSDIDALTAEAAQWIRAVVLYTGSSPTSATRRTRNPVRLDSDGMLEEGDSCDDLLYF